MKTLFGFSFLFLFYTGFAQSTKQELAKDFASAERKAILQAIKEKVKPDLKLLPKLVVEKLTLKNGFAFFTGNVKDPAGKAIDFRKTRYKELVEEGVFDGDGTTVLLKKINDKWKVLAYAIGPTDVAWACWWKEFKAPKEIFTYAEGCE